LSLFTERHRELLRIFHEKEAGSYSELLVALDSILTDKVAPHSAERDLRGGGIEDVRKELLANGVCTIPFPKEFGGMALPFTVYAMAMELVGSADASVALSLGIHNTAASGISQFGNEQQKKRYVENIISGRKLAAFALTEPTSGSDAKAMGTKALRKGGNYVIKGSKTFITNAGEADVYFVFAATEKGPSSFIVEKSFPGISFGEDLPKLGMRGSRTSEVRFSDCIVPEQNLVGQEGMGFEYAKSMLNASRIVMGAICVGISEMAFRKALRYSKDRKAFGETISKFQLTREKIADMRTEINSGRLMCLYASRLKDRGQDYSSEAAQAKVLATEMSIRVCDRAIQIFGGYGYTADDLHRHWRDARLLTIGEGTSEVLRMLIAGRELVMSV
jgi:alkylation response protein AidB-like acyl-CoA dehydrogenase